MRAAVVVEEPHMCCLNDKTHCNDERNDYKRYKGFSAYKLISVEGNQFLW
jgi:hypothetical protein